MKKDILIRIVRMSFQEEHVESFLAVFNQYKSKIRHMPGCIHLELLKDYDAENVYITYSYWIGQEFLDQYRDSDTFKEVWGKAKALFKDKPIAFSCKKYMEIND